MVFTLTTLFLLLSSTSAFVVLDSQAHAPVPLDLSGPALVDHINTAQKSWVAEHNYISDFEKNFKVMDERFADPLIESDETLFVRGEILPEPLPDNFDARERWPDCKSIKLIRNQATCGSCWAFGAAEIISDRICIQSNGTQQPIISVEDILSCCGASCGKGCQGGYSIEALRFWKSSGAVTGGDYNGAGCMPYSFAPCKSSPCKESTTPTCKTTCQSSFKTAGYKEDKHYGSSAYKITNSVAAIQTEIYHNGPVEASYKVYNDFYQYKSGVYHYVYGKLVGGHAVKIVGWGTENGEDYWLIANSWGSTFGYSGFFKMRRGTNECGIEGNVVAGIATLGAKAEKTDDDDGASTSCGFMMCTLTLLAYYLI